MVLTARLIGRSEDPVGEAVEMAERLFDEDLKNTTHQAMAAKVGTLYAKFVEKTAFIQHI